MAKYTPGDVDENVTRFESCAVNLTNAKGIVKRTGAERDMLSSAEKARDLMDKALGGDKYFLAKVFGGDTGRIKRYRDSYDSLAELGLDKDQRWKDVIERIEAIEKIIQELGAYKPPERVAAPAPSSLKYKGVRKRISPRRNVRLRPALEGDECTFSVGDALPEGLLLSPETGEITGSIEKPTSEVKFSIIAKNTNGEVRAELQFAVLEPPPGDLKYNTLPDNAMLLVGSQVVFQPDYFGFARQWTVEPALPEGMGLDEKSGIIFGAPEKKMDLAQFEITAINEAGKCKVIVRFGAVVPAPVGLEYPTLSNELAAGFAVHFEPEIEDGVPTEFSVSPALPEGLKLDKITGVIGGRPSVPTDETEYIVKAINDGGICTTAITFAVVSLAPTSLVYAGSADAFTNTTMVSLLAKIEGGRPDSFSVEPALPEGLLLDTSTGNITGIPSALCDKTTWLVTASNEAGSCSGELCFAVTRAPPSELSYPSLHAVYPAKRPVEILPTLEGEINEVVISPELPTGLQLDSTTGVITGIPTSASPETQYNVTASNEVGSTSAKITFAVEVLPPTGLMFPEVDETYYVGEDVVLAPKFEGGVDRFTVSPALPAGMLLDENTGIVSGAPESVTKISEYEITASNEGGQTSCVVSFKINPCAPKTIEYPTLGQDLVVDDRVEADPEINPGTFKFSVTPALPAGLKLDEKTGRISGSPSTKTEEATYNITAKNVSGSVSIELTLEVFNRSEVYVTPNFANIVEEILDIAELIELAPSKELKFGDWMVWMVHRAWLNDPSLTELNFNQSKMPLPHEEYRVAPKLVKALETNTYLEILSLANSNLQKPTGHEFAEAMKKNCTLKVINIESNFLDSACLRDIADGIGANKNTKIRELRVSYQHGMGKSYGRPVEQSFGEMMHTNNTITKLGLVMDDKHWADVVNRCILRNVDYARRRRKRQGSGILADSLPVENRTLKRIYLEEVPSSPCADVLSEDNIGAAVFKQYLVESKMVPSPTQLQNFCRNIGKPMKFADLKPTIEQCRFILLNSAADLKVSLIDAFGASIDGTLLKAQAEGLKWTVELVADEKRLVCKSEKEPAIAISSAWVDWLNGKKPKDDGEAQHGEEPKDEDGDAKNGEDGEAQN